jgi:hypothetical protein
MRSIRHLRMTVPDFIPFLILHMLAYAVDRAKTGIQVPRAAFPSPRDLQHTEWRG